MKHKGLAFVSTDDGPKLAEIPEHEVGTCEEAAERTIEETRAAFAQGEVVYEAPGAKVSVGYSKQYAAGWDTTFGGN